MPVEQSENTRLRSQDRLKSQLLRFLAVGGSSVVVDMICYLILVGYVDRLLAKGLSYSMGVLVGFAGNKFWTFGSRGKSISEPLLYVLIYSITLVLNITINGFVYELGISCLHWDRAAALLGFLVATGVTTVLNFLGLKFFTFRASQILST